MRDCSSCKLQELGQKIIPINKSQVNPTNISKFCKMGKKPLKIHLAVITYFPILEVENKYSQYMFRYVDLFICKEKMNKLMNK